MKKNNGVMMQYFHWYSPADGNLWNTVTKEVKNLAELGITALWLPPAFKASAGKDSVGYDIYDLYDLGEFNQKGSVRTKYGNKEEYLTAITEAHKYDIDIYADIIFNHKAGADMTERVLAQRVDRENRNITVGERRIIEAWTKFVFPGRIELDDNLKVKNFIHSDFIWDYLHFDAVDWDQKNSESAIFKFVGHGETWEKMITNEKGNYDYLMFSDIDYGVNEVKDELKRWAKWFLETTNVDGFRLDAIKHITIEYFNEWLDFVRSNSNKELFTVGEYWAPHDYEVLIKYLQESKFRMSLFDATLQNKFHTASKNYENFDLSKIFSRTIVEKYPVNAVTLVDNHDTQPLQALEAPVEDWFKPLAYAIILLRQEGYPCVFYPDIYGAKYTDKGRDGNLYEITLNPVKQLPQLLMARHNYAYGEQINYLDHNNTIGWTRLGNEDSATAMAVLISNGTEEGYKDMYVGQKYNEQTFIDILGGRQEKILINKDGIGRFFVNKRGLSVWIKNM